MLLGLGGNPYGPAGTGKTESVKALGNLFGRQVLVFNCDEVRHWLMRLCCVSCRAEIPFSQIVPVVFSYVISQSDVEHDNLYLFQCKTPLHVLIVCKLLRRFHSPMLISFDLFQFPHYSRAWI